MVDYFIERQGQGLERIDSAIYESLVSGTAILRAHETDGRVELDLSESLRVSVFAEGSRSRVRTH